MAKSNILLIAICSNGKQKGGNDDYNPEGSFCSLVPEFSGQLIEARKLVFDLIKSGRATRMGIPLSQFPHNENLSDGPDFGGCAQAEYMSSGTRFSGRFYKELGQNREDLIRKSPHHFLILCGVYGLLTPDEMIQEYNCCPEDSAEIGKIWQTDNILTSLLMGYIRNYGIIRIFDMTADPTFRSMIDWEKLKSETEVFRIFGNENSGPDLLPSLGVLCREYLLNASEQELLALQPGCQFAVGYEDVVVIPSDQPPAGFLGDPADIASNISGHSSETQFKSGIIATGVVLDHPRDINVTAGQHNTMFDRKIQKMADLPPDARKIFEDASRIPDVLEVFLGRFHPKGGRSKGGYYLTLDKPKENMGSIFCKLRGPGKIGSLQEIEIRVTKGWEKEAYLKLSEFDWADF